MAKKSLELNNYDYFTALYEGKKVRGTVSVSGYSNGETYRFCNKTFGEDSDDEDDADGFPKYFDVEDVEDGADLTEALAAAGITEVKVVNDQRQKKVIDGDKIPEIAGYRVIFSPGYTTKRNKRVKEPVNDQFTFGCGAVQLLRKEIEDYLEVRTLIESMKDKGANYQEVARQVNEQTDESSFDTKDVKDLLDFYTT